MVYLLILTALFALASGIQSMRLVHQAGLRRPWLILSAAIFLGAARPAVDLVHWFTGSGTPGNLVSEGIALIVSLLFFTGLILTKPEYLSPLLAIQSIRLSEKKFRLLTETAFEGVAVTEAGRFVEVSDQFAKLFGYRKKELVGKYAEMVIAEEARPHTLAKILSGYDKPYASVCLRKDGATFDVEVCGRNFTQDGHEFRVTALRDITERRKAMNEIMRLTKFNRSILQSMAEGVVVDDMDGNFMFVNPAAASLLGYQPEEMIGKAWTEFFPPDQHEIVRAANERRKQGISDRYQVELMRKDNTRFPVLISGSPRMEGGVLEGTLAVFMDITARKEREREQEAILTVANALRVAETRQEMLPILLEQITNLFFASGAAIVMQDALHNDLVAELGIGAWENWTKERIKMGQGVSGHVIATGEPYLSADIQHDKLFARPELLGDVRAILCMPLSTLDKTIGAVVVGRERTFEAGEVKILTAIADMAANAIRRTTLMGTLEERVLERTQELEAANERLKELDRLKSDFVSNVSHELRTPITNILLYLNLLERHEGLERRGHYMEILRTEANRLAHLIEDLLTLSRLDEGMLQMELEPHVLDALILDVLAAQQVKIQSKALEVQHEPDPELPAVHVNRGQMIQVFTNLIGNAVAYSPPGEQIWIAIGVTEVEGTAHATVRVQNASPAIPEEDMPHVFDRFYRGKTGRESGEHGTGLGLAICKEIVERHGGWIDVQSGHAQGTTFVVWLPVRPRRRA